MIQREDNRFKWHIRDAVLNALYIPVEDHYHVAIDDLVKRNTMKLQQHDMALHKSVQPGHTHRSFAYNGKFYNLEQTDGPPVRNRVHPELEAEVKTCTTHYEQILNYEKTLVAGYLTAMLSESRHPGDYLPLLPQSLHDPLKRCIAWEDWSVKLSQEKIDAFLAKHQPRYDLIRQRMATNLIL